MFVAFGAFSCLRALPSRCEENGFCPDAFHRSHRCQTAREISSRSAPVKTAWLKWRAASTFTSVLSLVPLATVAFALFTAFPIFGSFQSSLQDFLAVHLMPSQINSQIFKYLNQFASKAKGLTTVGMIILFVTSVMTMMTVESAFNVIWRVRKPRPLAQRVLVYWAIITLGPILFGCSLSISSYLFAQSLALRGFASPVAADPGMGAHRRRRCRSRCSRSRCSMSTCRTARSSGATP